MDLRKKNQHSEGSHDLTKFARTWSEKWVADVAQARTTRAMSLDKPEEMATQPKNQQNSPTAEQPSSSRNTGCADKILQLKVVLRDIKPLIWRRIQVSSNVSFLDLRNYVINAMGWRGYHLHEFIVPASVKKKQPRVIIATDDVDDDVNLSDHNVLLSNFLTKRGDRVLFEYDFGNCWLHEIRVEKILSPVEVTGEYPKCIDGRRACPPEDCGGEEGYGELMEAYQNSNHPEYQSLIVDWLWRLYPGWDPEVFDKEKVFKNA